MAAFFNTLILLGALQGFIISAVLFFTKRNKQSNRILAGLILLIALASFNLYGNYVDWFGSDIVRLIFTIVPLVMVMPFGPLIYFYIQSSLDPGFKINRQQRRHFYPGLIDLVPSFTVIIFLIGIITKTIANEPGPWGEFIDNCNIYSDIPRWISVSVYVWLSHRYLIRYKISSGTLPANFKWLQQFIRSFIVFQAIWFVYLIPYVIPAYTQWVLDTFGWYPIYLPMAILIYWLGIKGYTEHTKQVEKKNSIPQNSLSADTIQQTIAALEKAMQADKVFLNPELNIALLSQHINVPGKTVSAVLNQQLQKSFPEFINAYRVDAFKEMMCQPGTENLTMAGVAAKCGFNSQATFQRTFKEVMGMPPSAYFRSIGLKIN